MPKPPIRFLAILFVVLGVILIGLNLDLFKALFFNDVMPGWDGEAHLAIGKLYAEHIFPSTWGWINQWYTGMPFPQFYPPLFYFLVALVSKILFFLSYDIVFRLFVFTSLIATPCLIAFLAYRLTHKRITTILAGLIAVILLSFCGPDLNIGVGVGGTINTGLLANSLAFNFFVLWLVHFFQQHWTRKNYVWGVLFLTGIFLTNVHLIVPALIFFFIRYVAAVAPGLFKADWKNILRTTFVAYVPYGLIALGLAAFWVVPMLSRYDYFSTTTLNVEQDVIFYYFIIFSYLPFFFAVTFLVRRAIGVRYLAASIALLAIVVSLNTVMGFSSEPTASAIWSLPI